MGLVKRKIFPILVESQLRFGPTWSPRRQGTLTPRGRFAQLQPSLKPAECHGGMN
jgi:hypothetical protein